MEQTGKYLVIAGTLIVVAGLIIWLAPNTIKWFGHLPGDIHVEKPGFGFYAPLGSMLLLSIVISILLWIVRKFMP